MLLTQVTLLVSVFSKCLLEILGAMFEVPLRPEPQSKAFASNYSQWELREARIRAGLGFSLIVPLRLTRHENGSCSA